MPMMIVCMRVREEENLVGISDGLGRAEMVYHNSFSRQIRSTGDSEVRDL